MCGFYPTKKAAKWQPFHYLLLAYSPAEKLVITKFTSA